MKNVKTSLNLQKNTPQAKAATPSCPTGRLEQVQFATEIQEGDYKRFFDLVAKHQLFIIYQLLIINYDLLLKNPP